LRISARAFQPARRLRARRVHSHQADPAEIAYRRDPGLERAQRGLGAPIARLVRGQRLGVGGEVRAAVGAEVDVRVDQARDDRAPIRVDRAGKRVEAARAGRRARIHDSAAFTHHDGVIHHAEAAPVV